MLPNTAQFSGCMYGGAIGDAWGSTFENVLPENPNVFYYGGRREENRDWMLTDDTMLTLATCEVLRQGHCTPELLGQKFVEYLNRNELPGIGASTLKAITDLGAGLHWTQVGRKGEYAAGNGAAMRIAPFAFYPAYGRSEIRDFCRLTHHHDEAYVGALTVFLIIRQILKEDGESLTVKVTKVVEQLPDTNVKDRMIQLFTCHSEKYIHELSAFGNNGYVVNAVPFAIFSAIKVPDLGFSEVLNQIIQSGGDTDTNASIAGQIMGAFLGYDQLPMDLLAKLRRTAGFGRMERVLG